MPANKIITECGKLQASHDDLVYLAGIIDGEGSILGNCYGTYGKGSQSVFLSISNTSSDLMDWLCNKFGGKSTNQVRYDGNHKEAYHWMLYARGGLVEILRAILPHLKIKQLQAQIALDYFAELHNSPNKYIYALWIKELNRRGK